MAYVNIDPELLKVAYRYANTRANKAKRDYANRYVGWLRNGAECSEPERGRLSYMAAQAVRIEIDAMKLWEHVIR